MNIFYIIHLACSITPIWRRSGVADGTEVLNLRRSGVADGTEMLNSRDTVGRVSRDTVGRVCKKYIKDSRGLNAQFYGKYFEEKTNNEPRLIKQNFYHKSGYLTKNMENENLIFGSQQQIKKYIKLNYNIDLFRFPDEAYLFESIHGGIHTLKILEKKEQKTNGSVETKLWASPALKREYEIILGNKFNIKYGLCVNLYLKNLLCSKKPKYNILQKILNESNIDILYGDDEDYFTQLDKWIYK